MKMNRWLALSALWLAANTCAMTQDMMVSKIEPGNWWIGMKHDTVSLLLYGKNLKGASAHALNKKAEIYQTKQLTSSDHLIVKIRISDTAKAGNFEFALEHGKKKTLIKYPLRAREFTLTGKRGFTARDVMYLIMPDRFANGDPTNDNVEGYADKADRSKPFGRHGGDIKGISDKLDYLNNLGITTIWLTPVLENNEPQGCYHGYAITDFYKVDPRLGSNQDYYNLVKSAHNKNMKVVKDLVLNHTGSQHPWNIKPPDPDWIHYHGQDFHPCSFRASTVADPYAAKADKLAMTNGWFDKHMPDLNQRNPDVAAQLIQATIWWIEMANIDGIRMDTYPYPDKDFMADWVSAVKSEYPEFEIVGEVWITQPELAAYWLQSKIKLDNNRPTLSSITDFPLQNAMTRAFTEPAGWDTGLMRLYAALASDFIYEHPHKNVIFFDNHDLTRTLTYLKGDLRRQQMALAFLLTTRGVPQLYYGVEVNMEGDGASHPNVRKNFMGGWPGDARNAFTEAGRTADEQATFSHLQKLLQWRKERAEIHKGRLLHYVPEQNIYVYFRIYEGQTTMVCLNGNETPMKLNLIRFKEGIMGKKQAQNALTKEKTDLTKDLELAPLSALILEL
jgi:glycosidase